jgi:hypothetical protein
MYTKSSCRKFLVCTEPTVADPAWVQPIIETTEGSYETHGGHNFYKVLEPQQLIEILTQMQHKISRDAGYNEGVKKVLQLFGITYEEYLSKL